MSHLPLSPHIYTQWGAFPMVVLSNCLARGQASSHLAFQELPIWEVY